MVLNIAAALPGFRRASAEVPLPARLVGLSVPRNSNPGSKYLGNISRRTWFCLLLAGFLNAAPRAGAEMQRPLKDGRTLSLPFAGHEVEIITLGASGKPAAASPGSPEKKVLPPAARAAKQAREAGKLAGEKAESARRAAERAEAAAEKAAAAVREAAAMLDAARKLAGEVRSSGRAGQPDASPAVKRKPERKHVLEYGLESGRESGRKPGLLRVGPGEAYPVPSAAAKAARDGDVVEIRAGTYSGDVAVWLASNLVIRGVGGRPEAGFLPGAGTVCRPGQGSALDFETAVESAGQSVARSVAGSGAAQKRARGSQGAEAETGGKGPDLCRTETHARGASGKGAGIEDRLSEHPGGIERRHQRV